MSSNQAKSLSAQAQPPQAPGDALPCHARCMSQLPLLCPSAILTGHDGAVKLMWVPPTSPSPTAVHFRCPSAHMDQPSRWPAVWLSTCRRPQ